MASTHERQRRLDAANELIALIASRGRHFFAGENGSVTRFEVDARGRVWLIDKWRGDRIYTHYAGRWHGFTEGSTLRSLCCSLRDFITKGTLVPAHKFGPWPSWVCEGDPWAYGADMVKVREFARQRVIAAEAESPAPAVEGTR